MVILYAYDTNEIFVEPIKTRSGADMLCAHGVLYNTLEDTGQATKLNIIENEASTELNKLFQKSRTVVQLEPPHIHKINAAKRAIRTLKNNCGRISVIRQQFTDLFVVSDSETSGNQ